jgi:hypothetical protein
MSARRELGDDVETDEHCEQLREAWRYDMAGVNKTSPDVPFLSMWTTPDGLSSIGPSELRDFVQGSVGGKASPSWMKEMPGRLAEAVPSAATGG